MAKTELFSRLRSLTARSLGAQASRAENQVARRELFAYALSASLLGCGPTSTAPTSKEESKRRVAVIGAGLAGLHCAYRLAQAMVDVTVYEANTRVGGRVFTGRKLFSDERLSCELGGEFFESTDATMLSLADELALPIEEHAASSDPQSADTYWARGAEVLEEDLVAALGNVGPALLAALNAADRDEKSLRLLDNTSLSTFFANNVPDGKYPDLLHLLNAAFHAEFGLDTELQSALNAWRLFPLGSTSASRLDGRGERRFRAQNGNDAFTDALKDALGTKLVRDRRLTRIAPLSDGPYQLTLEDHVRGVYVEEADLVVFALPFSILRTLDLQALSLSGNKRRAITDLGYGSAVKLVGAFSGKPWRTRYQRSGSVTSDLAFQTAFDSTRGTSQSESLLTNLFADDATLGDVSVEDNMTAALADLDSVWGPISGDYIDGSAVRMHWPSSRFAAGSASVYEVRQYSTFGGSEGTQEGNLHFCGEHCSVDFKGTLEGAAETGALVAAKILGDFGIPLPEALKPIVHLKTLVPQPALDGPGSLELGIGERRATVASTHGDFAIDVLPRLLSGG